MNRCPICGEAARPVYRLQRHGRTALRCTRCGLTFLDQAHFSQDEQATYYGESAVTSADAEEPVGSAPDHLQNLRNALDQLPASAAVLDIGCGAGDLLDLLRERGYTVCGIEPSTAGTRKAQQRGLDVIQGTVEDAELDGRTFDLVVSTHVIEHVSDAQAFLKSTTRFLSAGGLQVIVTPNGDAPLFRLLGRFWTYATPDEHNFIFTAESLRLLAAQHGFSVVESRTTTRRCSVLRGVLREIVMSRRPGGTGDVSRVAVTPHSRPRLVDRAIRLADRVEAPFLRLLNVALRRFHRGDELLVTLVYQG